MTRRTPFALPAALLFALTASFLGAVRAQDCVPSDQGGCLPVAAESERVDVAEPTFSDPTNITNPLFPIALLHSALLLGHVEDESLRIEVTLLPETRVVDFNGQPVETLISQFVAYTDGRLHEVALDLYAQADDGSVWYLGEDVYNYENGAIADTEGTWHAGQEGPAAMIMPGNPRVGDVYRPENIPGLVFEEVTVKEVGLTVDGPLGPVEGAILVQELHQDGFLEDKTFAPGYGEFISASDTDLESLALAVPTDALEGMPPTELTALTTGAADVVDGVRSDDWDAATASVEGMTAAWETYQGASDVPPLLDAQMSDALDALAEAVEGGDAAEATQAAIDAEHASLALELRYRAPVEIDLARADLWARQLLLDAGVEDPAGIKGDVVVLEWVWDRVAHTTDQATAEAIEDQLIRLRAVADTEDFAGATAATEHLRTLLASIDQTSS